MNHRSFARPLQFAVVASLSASLAASLGAQTPLTGYTPLTTRYRVVTKTNVSQAVMGQTQESETTADQLTTVVIAKDGGGLALTITLDSLTATGSGGPGAPDPASAVGLKLTGTMSTDGQVVTSKVTDKAGNASDSPFAANMRSFLPRLKVGATPGMTWVDTTSTTRPQNGGLVTTSVVTTYKLVGDTTVASAKAWRLASTSEGTVSGTGNQGGADYTLKGTIIGAGTLVVGAGGALVAAELKGDATMMVDVPMASMQIPITQKQTTTFARVP